MTTIVQPVPVVQAAPSAPGHCPYAQAALLEQALAPDKMRVAFLLGAGCPVSIRVPRNGVNEALIPDIAGLTKIVRTELESDAEAMVAFASVLQRLATSGNATPNVEEILSQIRSLTEVASGGPIDGLTHETLLALDQRVCEITTGVVNERLPDNSTPYHRLASWIGVIPRKEPAEVFTSNYDLLMEEALEERRVPYFDGFVGSYRTFFDIAAMEQDALPARWARLWKVHGSINWWRTATSDVERRSMRESSGDRQLIYPSHLKYDQSRRQPYLAMIDRLKAFLGRGQAVLVTCGYSFADQHLNEVIVQGLEGNATAMCFGLLYGDRGSYPLATARARAQANLTVLAADGAVLGTVEREWNVDPIDSHALHGIAVETAELGARSGSALGRPKFLLGDFQSLGDFLARQLPIRSSAQA
ncbi:MAG: SIR2 family protein [Gemmatimonadetes bacterium]|nr:SIR2 family protein [Gemmatimonadota bacterium]